MKIAFFHELHFGGARRVVFEYANVLKNKYEISLYYVDEDKELDIEKYFKNSYLYRHKLTKYLGGNWQVRLYKDFIEPIQLYFLHQKIAKAIDKENFDLVFVHISQYTHAPFILRFLKTPSVYFCHEPLRIAFDSVVAIPRDIAWFKKIYEKIIRQYRMIIDKTNVLCATKIITNSKYSRLNIKSAYGVESEICYLGVNPDVFRPLGIKKEYDILFVGEPVRMEGYDLLLDVAKYFKQKPKIHVIKKENGKYLSDHELTKEYNKAKIVVVFGRFDPFSMIPLEAMACGIVPVLVNEGGAVESIENGRNGFLVQRNGKAIYDLLQNLLSDETLRTKIGAQGRKQVINFWNWQKSCQRFEAIIKTI